MKGQETIEAEDTNQVPQAVTGQGVGNLPVTGVAVPVHADGRSFRTRRRGLNARGWGKYRCVPLC